MAGFVIYVIDGRISVKSESGFTDVDVLVDIDVLVDVDRRGEKSDIVTKVRF